MSSFEDPNSCALNESGNLKDVNNIHWFHSSSDISKLLPQEFPECVSTRVHNTVHMKEALQSEKTNESGSVDQQFCATALISDKAKCKHANTAMMVAKSSDDEYIVDETNVSVEEISSDDKGSGKEITLDELADALPSKTLPESTQGHKKGKAKAKMKTAQPQHKKSKQTLQVSESSSIAPETPKPHIKGGGTKHNPIYYFYEKVLEPLAGHEVQEGSKYYKC
ncbi:hypothetical protein FISHEDRAFT_62767 [Fistulina hepatica ATCC 64428]|nr:hypothetical protein FISHEDRAFT_62767 [Fistulina hepatica ATCC 64428]